MKDALTPRTVSESCVTTTELVLPSHTNQLGTIFGGQLMAWIDLAASIAAARHARGVCVTASIDALHFVAPVRIGQHVRIQCAVNSTGHTSLEIGARLDTEDVVNGTRSHVATAYLTFVAIDEHGNPRPVPPVIPETPDELRRFHAASLRRASRLELKDKLTKKS